MATERPKNTVWVSASMSNEEKLALDAEAERQGLTRNRLIRNWIAGFHRPTKA